MPKDGQGSSSPFVEAELDHHRLRTRSRPKDLFPVPSPDDFPYRSIDVSVHNDRSGSTGHNFLGRVRVPTAGVPVPAPGEEAHPQLFPLGKRSLFSHIHGEISLKIYRIKDTGTASELSADKLAEKKKNNHNHPKQVAQPQQAQTDPAELVPVRPNPSPVEFPVPLPVVLATPNPYPDATF